MARDLSNTVNVPTFSPTMEQLENWEEFVDTMEEAGAHKIGIAKLVMPEGWQARQAGYSLGNIDLKVGKVLNQHIIPTKVDGAFAHTAISESVKTENMTVAKFLAMTLHPDHQPPVGNFLELEEKYWARHHRPDLKPPVYGADIHSTLMDHSLKVFNLNKMNQRPEAILHHDEGDRFGGVHDSYIFLGMWASTFSWHVEDQDLYGLNYLHRGAPKAWYCVPPSDAHKLEALARQLFPSQAAICHNLLRHKTVILHPALLEANGIKVHKVVQEERQAVVVFPLAYHQGFNHGFNMAEAVNFGSKRWVEYGKRSRTCLCLDSARAVKIEMTPLVKIYQPEMLHLWKKGKDFQLHPEDPDYLHKFVKDVKRRVEKGELSEGELHEVMVTLKNLGTVPDWYEVRFGVRFQEEKALVTIGHRAFN